jgi:hypothetical protein
MEIGITYGDTEDGESRKELSQRRRGKQEPQRWIKP